MAELTPTERLQPCLLDRLTDDDPKSSQESRNSRVISLQRYREAVLEVMRSVLNYGTRDLTGLLSSSLNIGELEQHIAEAIRLFEPRIIPHSLVVKAITDPERINSNILAFEIRGDLWARPLPDQLFIKTEIDLDTGQCTF